MTKLDNLIPITFGITGHCEINIDDQKRAADCISNVIKSFRARYPLSPFIFISPLARGADIIAAEAALSSDPSGNCNLYVVLPYQLESYRKSIKQEWHTRFDELFQSRAALKILNELEVVEGDVVDLAYQQVGEFVAINSHVLFVMKNQEELAPSSAGTAEVVRFRKNGCVNLREITLSNLNHAEDGLVYEIRVRKSEEDAPPPTSKDDIYYVTPLNQTLGERESAKLKDVAKKRLISIDGADGSFLPKYRSFSYKKHTYTEIEIELFNKAIIEDRNLKRIISKSSSFLDQMRKISDVISNQNQKFFTRYFSIIIALVLISTISQTLQEIFQLFPEQFALLMNFFPLGLAAFLYFYTVFSKFKSKHESARSLCESLKVQAFWSRAKVPESAADHFLVGDFGRSSWVRRALRSCALIDSFSSDQSKPGKASYEELEKVRAEWLIGDIKKGDNAPQIPWLADKISQYKERVELVESLLKWASAIWLVSYLASLIIELQFMDELKPVIGPYVKYGQFLFLIPLIVIAMYKHYIDGRGFGVIYKRYQPLHHFYVQANLILSKLLDLARDPSKINFAYQSMGSISLEEKKADIDRKLVDLFRLVGISALGELSDWYITSSRVTIKNPVSKE
jgi:hypothetical protein